MDNVENVEITDEREKIKEQIVANIASYNEALSKGDLKVVNELDVALKELEVAYATAVAHSVYRECLATENPILTAIQRYEYQVIGHKDNKVDGIITDRVIVEDKTRVIDLFKMVKFCNDRKESIGKELPSDWVGYVEKFNQLMTIRVATELGFTQAQIKKLSQTYYMSDVARKIELGETPVSNTQMCKVLQTCIDKILLLPDEKGKNTLKANNKDVAYVQNLYAKKGKETLNVQVAKHDFMRRLVTDVIYRLVNDKKYGVEFKAIKEKKA